MHESHLTRTRTCGCCDATELRQVGKWHTISEPTPIMHPWPKAKLIKVVLSYEDASAQLPVQPVAFHACIELMTGRDSGPCQG